MFHNARITGSFGPDVFEVWQTHDAIEVGTFEQFLPELYVQRSNGAPSSYVCNDPEPPMQDPQYGFDAALFETRHAMFERSTDLMATLA